MENGQTKLSVNINKVALIRNARGGDRPNLVQVAIDCEQFGADGITVHPRPDERHVRFSDLIPLKEANTTEFNIEGYPSDRFMKAVLECKPHQCTLVPDPPGVLTSDSGWDTHKHEDFLKRIIDKLHEAGIRTSLFVNPSKHIVDGALKTGTDRVEIYTGTYANAYHEDRFAAVEPHSTCAAYANSLGLGVNAGHDLDLQNLTFYKEQVPELLEVSIGHALISDALYFGLENVIPMYKRKLSYINHTSLNS